MSLSFTSGYPAQPDVIDIITGLALSSSPQGHHSTTLEDRRANPGPGEDLAQALLWFKSHLPPPSLPPRASFTNMGTVVSSVIQENSEQAGHLGPAEGES